MSLHLTPDMLSAAYDFLRTTRPFSAWRLPDPDEVEFHVTRSRTRIGRWRVSDGGSHCIEISGAVVGHACTLIQVMAHEMIHLHQRERGTETTGADHNAEFHRLARIVCRAHGFDPKSF